MESITSQATTSPVLFPEGRGCHENFSREREEILIDDALQGRDGAFWDLIEPYVAYLTRVARMRLRSDPEAEDIVQQAILRALSHLRQFRGEASFKTWLTAITCNEVSHWRRGRALAAVRPLQENWASGLRDLAGTPDLQFQRRQEVERLQQALTRLPEKYRRMIQLRDLHELSIAETARSLSLTTAAVKTRHHRARKLLARSFSRLKRAA